MVEWYAAIKKTILYVHIIWKNHQIHCFLKKQGV